MNTTESLNGFFFFRSLPFVLLAGCMVVLANCGGGGSSGSEVTLLTWDPPTSDSDGQPPDNLEGYRVYRGASPGAYTWLTHVDRTTHELVLHLEPGTHYFVVTAYDAEYDESPFSEELEVTVMEAGEISTLQP